jgi:hypothetical protein
MTTPHDLYIEATRRGLRLEAVGDFLAVKPKGKCPPDFAAELREHKAALLAWLERKPCPGYGAKPPDDLPLVTTRPQPATYCRELVIHYEARQTDNRTGPLAAWLARRESRYYDGPGAGWDCGDLAYAAARDAACWQLNRSERQLCQLLAGFEEAAKGRSTRPA